MDTLLSLDEPTSRYTTAIPEANATVRHVLTHTSQGSPGAVFRYDGSRFSALTAVVAACHGKLFRLALAEMLDRAAMTSSVPGHDFEQPTAALSSLFDQSTFARYATAVRRLARPYQTRGQSVVRAESPPRDINRRRLSRADVDERQIVQHVARVAARFPAESF